METDAPTKRRQTAGRFFLCDTSATVGLFASRLGPNVVVLSPNGTCGNHTSEAGVVTVFKTEFMTSTIRDFVSRTLCFRNAHAEIPFVPENVVKVTHRTTVDNSSHSLPKVSHFRLQSTETKAVDANTCVSSIAVICV